MAAQSGAIQQSGNGGMIISPETFHESFMKHMAGNRWTA
jgi:hypothetical protein